MQDALDRQRDEFIARIESKLNQAVNMQNLFKVHWTLI